METVGIRLARLPIRELKKVRDLEYFDGCLLAEFAAAGNARYLFCWVDSDDRCNRWLVLRTDENLVLRYLFREESLRSLLNDSPEGNVYLVDIDGNLKHHAVYIAEIGDLPDDYVPGEDSYAGYARAGKVHIPPAPGGR